MLVTLGIIAYNEENFICDLLENIKQQTYPHDQIELIFVDGLSTDATKHIMEEFKNSNNDFYDIKILDNKRRIQPSGWNIVINHCSGEVIIRVDAHALIPNDFVQKNVECITSGENVCGGSRTNIMKGSGRCRTILLMAENSMFGSGVASYRRNTNKKYVKTLAHACYKREVFDAVGLFNEKLIRSEDNELHYRIRQAGYKICMSGDIHSQYQTRSSLGKMIKQKYNNGKWVGLTSKISPHIFSLYHYIPFLFVIMAMLSLALFIVSFFYHNLWYLALPFLCGVSVYIVIDLLLTVKSVIEYREILGILLLPIIFPMLHIAYGFGTIIGLIKAPFVKLT